MKKHGASEFAPVITKWLASSIVNDPGPLMKVIIRLSKSVMGAKY